MKKYLLSLALLMPFSYTVQAADTLQVAAAVQTTNCEIKYNLKGWSAFFKTVKGTGTVSCSNGQSANVKLSMKGGGFTFGSFNIKDGTGRFSGVKNISDIYGGYFAMDGHAGAGKEVEGRTLPFKAVKLSMKGKGRGVNLGFSMGSFRISK